MNPDLPQNKRLSGHRSLSSWLGIGTAAVLLGFTLALGLSCLVLRLSPGRLEPFNAKHQLGMWSIGLLWSFILALSILFPSGRRAWGILLSANLAIYGLFLLSQFISRI